MTQLLPPTAQNCITAWTLTYLMKALLCLQWNKQDFPFPIAGMTWQGGLQGVCTCGVSGHTVSGGGRDAHTGGESLWQLIWQQKDYISQNCPLLLLDQFQFALRNASHFRYNPGKTLANRNSWRTQWAQQHFPLSTVSLGTVEALTQTVLVSNIHPLKQARR